jgi:hypothetical protein
MITLTSLLLLWVVLIPSAIVVIAAVGDRRRRKLHIRVGSAIPGSQSPPCVVAARTRHVRAPEQRRSASCRPPRRFARRDI